MEENRPIEPETPTAASEPISRGDAPVTMSPFERLWNVLLSPTETFEAVRERPAWIVPLIVIVAVSVTAGFIITPRMDMSDFYRGFVERQAEAEGWEDDQARVEEAIGEMEQQAARQGNPLFGLATVPLFMLVVALIFWGAMRAAGGTNTFSQTLGVTLYGWMPNVIKGILVIVFALRMDAIPFSERSTIVASNLGFLVSPSESPVLHAFLTWIDLFNIWTLVLIAIGLGVITRFSKVKTGIFLAVLYAIVVGVGVAFAYMMSTLMGG